MWFKILGALAVMFSSFIAGLYFSKLCLFRIQDLEQMKKAASIFQTELMYSASPLCEVFEQISLRTTGVVSMIFKKAAEGFEKRSGDSAESIWAGSVIDESGSSYFSPEDMENLFAFGLVAASEKFAVKFGDNKVSGGGSQRAVNDQNIAVIYSRGFQSITLHAQKISCLRMGAEISVQVKIMFLKVSDSGGKRHNSDSYNVLVLFLL